MKCYIKLYLNSEENVLHYASKQYWSVLQSQYLQLVQNFKSLNKTISPADDQKIQSLLDSLKNSEIKLVKVLLYIEKYQRLLELYNVQDNTTVLSIDHLAKFNQSKEHLINKVSGKRESLVGVLNKLVELIQDTKYDNTIQSASWN